MTRGPGLSGGHGDSSQGIQGQGARVLLGFRAEKRQRLWFWDLWHQVMETYLNTAFVIKGSSLAGITEKFTGSPDSGGISHNVCRLSPSHRLYCPLGQLCAWAKSLQ